MFIPTKGSVNIKHSTPVNLGTNQESLLEQIESRPVIGQLRSIRLSYWFLFWNSCSPFPRSKTHGSQSWMTQLNLWRISEMPPWLEISLTWVWNNWQSWETPQNCWLDQLKSWQRSKRALSMMTASLVLPPAIPSPINSQIAILPRWVAPL